jgi:hypothetical protein
VGNLEGNEKNLKEKGKKSERTRNRGKIRENR